MDLDVQFDYLFLAHGKKCQIKLIGLNILFLSHTLNTEKKLYHIRSREELLTNMNNFFKVNAKTVREKMS